ncbi:hypothetical protein, partial [Roseateles sp. P5_D6]
DLLSQHRQVLCENFFSELFSTQRTLQLAIQTFQPSSTNHLTTIRRSRQALRCDQRSPRL